MGVDGGEEEQMQEPTECHERIFVSVRLRPLSEKEIVRHDVSDWECINDNTIIYRSKMSVSERSMYLLLIHMNQISAVLVQKPLSGTNPQNERLGLRKRYNVFGSDCPNRQVYETGEKEVVLSVVSGINLNCTSMQHKEREFVLKFSAIEIYNESVRDLLSADSSPLRLLDDPERGIVVEKLTEETLRDWNHFKELLSVCEAQRQIGETSLNEASSRSHQILRVTIESSAREFLGNDKSSMLAATVSFVDLAGSERASESLSAGARLKEGCHINRSLLTLGTVIRKLSKGRNGHIPFRDSKLTRILQSSLGGNARTAIICTMSPARSHVEQSRSTLLFASCAKEVTTNAQVNVVMSDKALVKQLQRELARLENELKSTGTASISFDSAVLLREKDFEIENLKKQVILLTQQIDYAQSEAADPDPQYPKLQVQNSWDYESSIMARHALAVGLRSSPPDRQSYSSEESFLQLPDFKLNIPYHSSSPRLSPKIPSFVAINHRLEENGDHIDENSEAVCKEVRCIDSGRSSMNTYSNSNLPVSSPKIYQNYNMSSPRESSAISGLIDVGNEARLKRESSSLHWKNSSNHLDVAIPSPEKPCLWRLQEEISSHRSLQLTRSRSCKASLMTDLTSKWIERVEKDESTPPIGNEKYFTGRPESIRRKLSALKYDLQNKGLSRNGSQTSAMSATVYKVKAQISINESQSSLTSATDETSNLKHEKKLANQAVQVTEPVLHGKTVTDIGLDPISDNYGSPRTWSSEFKRLQRGIIELWHACNVTLVHRTYFLMLFKGDPKDYIYMKVEHRRLSFLNNVISHGNQTVENGRVFTRASSLKALRRERQMLSQQMNKRFSKTERKNLFLKWGIGLNTKHRRLQLAHCLWIDSKDMDHIT
ncbi:kinesin-like protein NACK1 isoform X1 [Gossypium australe]|uniref:Kinesin-like protein n=1 Tax=Gossypium australe TaxID=47621 RepID=A0A5B6W046_9ROSI|nr:kinesin-like protein NACK1 isoform X1 [Gossypium australe]